MTRPIRVGLLGIGNSGWFYHAERHLLGSPRFELVALAGSTEEKVAERAAAAGARGYVGWQALVADPEVELVVCALPNHLHSPAVLAALGAGKHVLVDKPMAVTVAEADAMIAAAEDAGLVLAVHQQRRWETDLVTIRQLLAEGAIGAVFRVNVVRCHMGYYRTAAPDAPHRGTDVLEWPHDRRTGGGIGALVAIHPIDQVLTLVGAPVTRVTGYAHQLPADKAEHWFKCDLGFDDEVEATVEVFRQAAIPPARFAVYGTEGTIVSHSTDRVELARFDGHKRTFDGLAVRDNRLGEEIYAALFDAIRNGGPLAVTAAEGRAAVEVMELTLRSAQSGSVPLRPTGSRRPHPVEGDSKGHRAGARHL